MTNCIRRAALLAGALLLSGTVAAQQAKKPAKPDVKVNFGGQKAPTPQLPKGDAKAGGEEDSSSLANALKNWFQNPQEGEPGAAGPEEGTGESAGGDGESADGSMTSDGQTPEGETGEAADGKNLFNKFVGLFQDGGEGKEKDPAEDENYRKIRELERFAGRDFRRQRYAETKKSLNDLITLKPYEPGYHFALGLVFRTEKRPDDALKKYQDVLDLGGPKPLVHLLMAEAVHEKGDTEKVLEHLKEAAVGGRNIIQDVQLLTTLSDYKADTDFIKLALSLEKYDVQTKRNQDPMTNPFKMREGGEKANTIVDPTGDGEINLTPEEQQRLLGDARKAYDRVLWYIKLEDEDKAMENYTQLRAHLEKKDLVTIPKIANDFRLLVQRMPALEAQIESIRLKFYYNQALVQLNHMKEAFQDGEYGRVKAIFEDIKKLGREMERTNPRYKPVADRVLAAGSAWITRTNIRQEFNSNKPTIQGIVIASGTKKAIINNRIYQQGERFEDFLVQKVENNRITFRYKGEDIPLVFRRY